MMTTAGRGWTTPTGPRCLRHQNRAASLDGTVDLPELPRRWPTSRLDRAKPLPDKPMSYTVSLFRAPGDGSSSNRSELRDIATLDDAIELARRGTALASPGLTPMTFEIHDDAGQLVLSYTGEERLTADV